MEQILLLARVIKKKEMEREEFFGIYSKHRVRMTNDLSNILSSILNEIHGTSFSERFWKIILRPYLSAIVSDRKRLSKEIIKSKVPLEVYVNTVFPRYKDIIYGRVRYAFKSFENWLKFGHLDNWNNFHNVGLGFHDKDAISSHVDIFYDNKYPFQFPRLLNAKRNKIDIQNFITDEYNENFLLNIIYHLPKVYIENFWLLFNRVDLCNPENKTLHVSYFENFFMSLVVAKYVENGAQLYFYQHGAFYGEFPYHSAHHFESSIADRFLTWGWKLLENDYPDKAYRLIKFKRFCNATTQIK